MTAEVDRPETPMSWESLGEGVGGNFQAGPLRPSRLGHVAGVGSGTMPDADLQESDTAVVLNHKINRALYEVRFAKAALNHAVRQLTLRAVGDKQVITSGLDGTFEKLHRARHTVAELQLTLSQLEP